MLRTFLADPIAGLSEAGGVLAVTTGVEGSAYRPLGASMAFLPDGRRIGSLSSGCIEEALSLEADKAWTEQNYREVRYGEGSPWIDIQLPCGAGLDISLWPLRDSQALANSSAQLSERYPHSLLLPKGGASESSRTDLARAQWSHDAFVLPRVPSLRLLAIGSGLETIIFTEIARQAGYDAQVATPDPFVSDNIDGSVTLQTDVWPQSLKADPQTAIVFFFHDHAFERALLQSALESSAFWIGAQGSRKKRQRRSEDLAGSGLSNETIARLAPRFGLIPSARDPQTLAISVLSDVVAAYKTAWFDPYFGDTAGAKT